MAKQRNPKEDKSNESKIERRYFPIGEMRAVKTDDGEMIIEGYPIVYEKYANMWGFKEVIRKGAAAKALGRSDEIVLWDHESGRPMAAKKNGTLEAKEDEKGVFIRADVSKTVWGRDGYEAIEAGVVDKMSFAFDLRRGGDAWITEEIEGVEFEVREILELGILYDYSPVTYPAYEDTTVDSRSRTLALRNRPEPGAPGEANAAVLEVRKDARDNINRLIGEIDDRHQTSEKEEG